MRALWTRWLDACDAPVDGRPLALVRILLPSVILADHLLVVWLGMAPLVYRHFRHGGMEPDAGPWYVFDALGPWGGLHALGLLMVAAALSAVGLHARPALFLTAFASAQLAHGFKLEDHAGYQMARTVLLILACSEVHRVWAIRCRYPLTTTRAWSPQLIRLLLALVYVNAGCVKLFPDPSVWTSPLTVPQSWLAATYPIQGQLDAGAWAPLQPAFQVLDWGTVGIELSSPLILTRYRAWWGLAGVALHVGLLLTLHVDNFQWLMLACYPLLFDRWLARWLDAPR